MVTGTGSVGIAEQLATEIDEARARCDRYVIVEALPYFAQLMPNHGAIYGEVVSNAYLDPGYRLTLRHDRRLVRLGWRRPGEPCHPSCPSGSHPNYTRIWESEVPSREITRDLLEALMIVASVQGEGGGALIVRGGAQVTRPTSGPAPGH